MEFFHKIIVVCMMGAAVACISAVCYAESKNIRNHRRSVRMTFLFLIVAALTFIFGG